ncbi:MAG: 3,4-dihydroxy-2-butanone-4-phosphate synthase [Planctomycetes bacterium]|nr:3,4-dihydroxy-2-butanone-4-phosphate synthase [Planctomycetota bacterium]
MAAAQFSRIEDAVEAIAAGRMVIVLDSEERENEGDLVAAADALTPHMVHFMITQARGQLCVPVTPETARRLALRTMVGGDDPSLPKFTIPVDHRRCSTGISPLERAWTIRAMVDEETTPDDFIRPGHVFPLIARAGGVLERPGHTESAVELARMAGRAPAGVLCEICSSDGLNMATRDELLTMSALFGIPIITIDELIENRRRAAGGRTETREAVALAAV